LENYRDYRHVTEVKE